MYGIYGIFTYIWLILMVNVGKIYHTWILWVFWCLAGNPFQGQITIFTILNLACFTDFGPKLAGKKSPTGGEWSWWNLPRFGIFDFQSSMKKKRKEPVVPGGEISFSVAFAHGKNAERWKPLHLFLLEACHLWFIFSYRHSQRCPSSRPQNSAIDEAPFSVRGMPLQPSWFWRPRMAVFGRKTMDQEAEHVFVFF